MLGCVDQGPNSEAWKGRRVGLAGRAKLFQRRNPARATAQRSANALFAACSNCCTLLGTNYSTGAASVDVGTQNGELLCTQPASQLLRIASVLHLLSLLLGLNRLLEY